MAGHRHFTRFGSRADRPQQTLLAVLTRRVILECRGRVPPILRRLITQPKIRHDQAREHWRGREGRVPPASGAQARYLDGVNDAAYKNTVAFAGCLRSRRSTMGSMDQWVRLSSSRIARCLSAGRAGWSGGCAVSPLVGGRVSAAVPDGRGPAERYPRHKSAVVRTGSLRMRRPLPSFCGVDTVLDRRARRGPRRERKSVPAS